MHNNNDQEVGVSAELQRKLELLRRAWGLPTTTAVLERLIASQLDCSVYEMTGFRPGPRLVVDNRPRPPATETNERTNP